MRFHALVVLLSLCVACEDGSGDKDGEEGSVEDCTPSGDEVCDGVDNNCDGQIDEGLLSTFYADADGDGFGGTTSVEACEQPEGFVADNTDCDDLEATAFPGGDEVCDDLDNDCDGLLDDADDDVDLTTTSTFWTDNDGDGYGVDGDSVESCSTPEGYAPNIDDCDDGDAEINPDTVWHADQDGDGFGSEVFTTTACEQPDEHVRVAGDCDDEAPGVNPDALEYCDSIDNNCDGEVDEATAEDATVWYEDSDGDGVGVDTVSQTACDQPDGYAALDGDCDDDEPASFPGASEQCDGIDNDCDGNVDFDAAVPGDYATIQAAIDALGDGEGVCVGSGTWSEALDLGGNDIFIVGQPDGSTILDSAGDVALTSRDGGVATVQDLQIANAGGKRGAVARVEDSELTVRRVDATDALISGDTTYGAFSVDNGTLTLEDVWVTDMLVYGTSTDVSGVLVYAVDSTLTVQDVRMDRAEITAGEEVYGTLYLSGSDAVIDGLAIENNAYEANQYVNGALMYALNSNAETHNVSFTGNTMEAASLDLYYGYVIRINGGSGIQSVMMTNTDISNNVGTAADDAWAAIYMTNAEDVRLENLQFTNNQINSGDDGYGIFYNYESQLQVINADIANNLFEGFDRFDSFLGYRSYGGDIWLTNVNVVDNTTDASARATLMYSSYGNSDGVGTFEYDYCNIYGNTAGALAWADDGVEGDASAFVGNVSIDPLYTDATGGDYTLSATSPVVDLGDPAILDADGSTSDIGAFGGPDGASW